MRRVRYLGQTNWAPRLEPHNQGLGVRDLLRMLDEKNLAAVSGMGFTALGAYFYFFIQFLQPQVIGVTLLCTILGFLMALLLKIEVLHIDLRPKEKLDVRFMIGVITMLSLVIIVSAIGYYGGQAGHALIAFLLTAMSTYLLFHSRVEIDDHGAPHRA
ncbi:MAG TPA: hypothetical protein EYP43_04185 [Thermoplasmata archaeon]|nr:hypothetical protein [Thermoplasmata archaeon]